jgi:hypothetical protein
LYEAVAPTVDAARFSYSTPALSSDYETPVRAGFALQRVTNEGQPEKKRGRHEKKNLTMCRDQPMQHIRQGQRCGHQEKSAKGTTALVWQAAGILRLYRRGYYNNHCVEISMNICYVP